MMPSQRKPDVLRVQHVCHCRVLYTRQAGHQRWDAHHVLHLCSDVKREICCAATGPPCDVTEGGPIRCHAILPVEEILYSL